MSIASCIALKNKEQKIFVVWIQMVIREQRYLCDATSWSVPRRDRYALSLLGVNNTNISEERT